MGQETLELRYLSHEDQSDAVVASILHLSNSILGGSESESHRTSLEIWKTRLSDPASTIVYIVPRPSGDDRFATVPLRSSTYTPAGSRMTPVAFIFAYPRSHPEPLRDGSSRSLHIWLAGVSEEYRGRRCLGAMVNALMELEKNRQGSPSLPTLTVCTSPTRFPSMWAWLKTRTQWVLEKEWDDGKVMLSLIEW